MCAKKLDGNLVNGMEQAAIQVISRAVKFDSEGRHVPALASYQEGIQLFIDVIKNTTDKKKQEVLRQKTGDYITRAERIKDIVQQQKDAGNYHEQIQIPNDGMGYGYDVLLSKYLEKSIKVVEIDDPYIRTVHQANNFLSFCELLVRYCPNLRRVVLLTGVNQQDEANQNNRFDAIRRSLNTFNISLDVDYSDSLHDREIRLDNGWVIKIGRGLDYFKPVSKFSLGFYDQNLRQCHETTVDYYFKQNKE